MKFLQPARNLDLNLSTTELLAREFGARLVKALGKRRIAEVMKLNATSDYKGCCASGDFCDSNLVMEAAFEALGSGGVNLQDPRDVQLWNSAWDLAKENGFYLGEGA